MFVYIYNCDWTENTQYLSHVLMWLELQREENIVVTNAFIIKAAIVLCNFDSVFGTKSF